jgi:PTS system glucitol/sorbitol-specific IIA component
MAIVEIRIHDPAGRALERYVTQVTAVGPLIPEFRAQGQLVLFGEKAPQELHEFVILHRPTVVRSAPHPGDVVELAGEAFTVTAVGHVVADTLLRLGHATLKADGATVAPMPGDICLEAKPLPDLPPGSIVRILASAP